MNNYGMFYRQVGCPKVIPKKPPGDLANCADRPKQDGKTWVNHTCKYKK